MASKTFQLLNGATAEAIGEHLVAWFQNTKSMISEGVATQEGYFVQAKDPDDGWKKIAGLTKALQVQLIKTENNVIVNCDFGKWSDKIGAGVVGMILFAPLAATAAFGAVKQSQLPNEVFAEIEKYIMCGGVSTTVELGKKISTDEIICPECKKTNPKGTKFCQNCGSPLDKQCSSCGTHIDLNTKFCPNCGENTQPKNKICTGCGAEIETTTKFCNQCGTKAE